MVILVFYCVILIIPRVFLVANVRHSFGEKGAVHDKE